MSNVSATTASQRRHAADGVATATATRVREMRAAEDAALDRWSTAVADHEHAAASRARAIARATAAVHRRMAPLAPTRYVRLEEAFDSTTGHHRSPEWMRDSLHVRRTQPAVNECRARLADIIEQEDVKLNAARAARAAATDELIQTAGLELAVFVTGLSPHQLHARRSGR